MPIVQEHGAAVVALTIDEQGQAPRPRTGRYGWRPGSSTTSPARWGLTLPDILSRLPDRSRCRDRAGGDPRDGIETIEAIRQISRLYPGVNFTLGSLERLVRT
jgi:5-methyltetrahydrofolate--homocysteine methyltransferase